MFRVFSFSRFPRALAARRHFSSQRVSAVLAGIPQAAQNHLPTAIKSDPFSDLHQSRRQAAALPRLLSGVENFPQWTAALSQATALSEEFLSGKNRLLFAHAKELGDSLNFCWKFPGGSSSLVIESMVKISAALRGSEENPFAQAFCERIIQEALKTLQNSFKQPGLTMEEFSLRHRRNFLFHFLEDSGKAKFPMIFMLALIDQYEKSGCLMDSFTLDMMISRLLSGVSLEGLALGPAEIYQAARKIFDHFQQQRQTNKEKIALANCPALFSPQISSVVSLLNALDRMEFHLLDDRKFLRPRRDGEFLPLANTGISLAEEISSLSSSLDASQRAAPVFLTAALNCLAKFDLPTKAVEFYNEAVKAGALTEEIINKEEELAMAVIRVLGHSGALQESENLFERWLARFEAAADSGDSAALDALVRFSALMTSVWSFQGLSPVCRYSDVPPSPGLLNVPLDFPSEVSEIFRDPLRWPGFSLTPATFLELNGAHWQVRRINSARWKIVTNFQRIEKRLEKAGFALKARCFFEDFMLALIWNHRYQDLCELWDKIFVNPRAPFNELPASSLTHCFNHFFVYFVSVMKRPRHFIATIERFQQKMPTQEEIREQIITCLATLRNRRDLIPNPRTIAAAIVFFTSPLDFPHLRVVFSFLMKSQNFPMRSPADEGEKFCAVSETGEPIVVKTRSATVLLMKSFQAGAFGLLSDLFRDFQPLLSEALREKVEVVALLQLLFPEVQQLRKSGLKDLRMIYQSVPRSLLDMKNFLSAFHGLLAVDFPLKNVDFFLLEAGLSCLLETTKRSDEREEILNAMQDNNHRLQRENRRLGASTVAGLAVQMMENTLRRTKFNNAEIDEAFQAILNQELLLDSSAEIALDPLAASRISHLLGRSSENFSISLAALIEFYRPLWEERKRKRQRKNRKDAV